MSQPFRPSCAGRPAVGLLGFLLACAPAAFAAEPAPPAETAEAETTSAAPSANPEDRVDEQVTVRGERLVPSPAESRRIPGSFHVVDEETLETARPFEIGEVLRRVSGIHVRDEEGLGLRPNIGFRGLNPTRSSRVLLLEDGIPLAYAPYGDNASYYHPPVDRFRSIEILKGSGQILYGPMTVGGVVNYLTPDPEAERSGFVKTVAGSRDALAGHFRFGGTYGRTGIVADALWRESDGAREAVSTVLRDANVKAVLQPGPGQRLTLKAGRYDEDSTVTYSGLTEAEFDEDPFGNPFHNDHFRGSRVGLSASHALRIGDRLDVTTNLYAARFQRHWWRQSSNSRQRPNDSADPGCGGMANLDGSCGNEGRLRLYHAGGLETRFHLRDVGRRAVGDLDFGARVHFEDQERLQKNGDSPHARGGVTVEDNERRNRALSAYFQDRIRFGSWAVTPGLRVERIRFERTNRLNGASGSTSLTEWIPGIGAAWSPSERVTAFAGLHRGFAPPRPEDVIRNSDGGVVELRPERSWNLEAGVRARPRRGLDAEATLFRMDYENQIVPASLAGGEGASLTNAGETLHAGLELQADVDFSELLDRPRGFYCRAAWTWLPEASFRGTRTSSIPGFETVPVSGNRLPYAPEHLLAASLGWRTRGGFDVSVEAVRAGSQYADDLNSVEPDPSGQRGRIGGSTVWNATLNREVRPLHATFFLAARNVLDRVYVVDRTRGILPGAPRQIQLGFRWDF